MNSDKTRHWKDDYLKSIDFYNDWFLHFAPLAFRTQRALKAKDVYRAFQLTHHLRQIDVSVLRHHPGVLPVLRMALAPPIARDRLV
ncbi:MAG: XamI family restriction endonuclease, partial [Kiritimatiellaeota bacterium]|nr:XamI family restriction endonuclease [Kiritimatiellota bacterium]